MLIPEGVTRDYEGDALVVRSASCPGPHTPGTDERPAREDAPNHAERWRELLAGGGVR